MIVIEKVRDSTITLERWPGGDYVLHIFHNDVHTLMPPYGHDVFAMFCGYMDQYHNVGHHRARWLLQTMMDKL